MGSSKALQTKRYEAFRALLLRARQQAGLTQAQAALAMERPQNFVSKCENGERRVDAVELEDFAATYGVPLSFFATLGTVESARIAKRLRGGRTRSP